MGLIILAGFFLYFMLRNILCPLLADDYSYAFIWDGKHYGNLMDGIGKRERVHSLKDIFVSLRSHYFTWGGRLPAHFFVQLFVLLGKSTFNFFNTLAMSALMILILVLGGVSLSDTQSVLWAAAGFWFGVPFLIGTAIWLTGSCNYLWMSVIQCAFILPYAQGFRVSGVIISLLGLLAGMSNEGGGAGVFVVLLCFMTQSWLAGTLEAWQVLGFVFFCAGYAVIMLAPGNMYQLRLKQQLAPEYTIPESEMWTSKMFIGNFCSGFLPVFARELLLYVPIVLYFAKGHSFTDSTGLYILTFCLGSLAVLCAMMFSPNFPERAGFPSAIFLLAASVCAMKNLGGQVFVNWLAVLLIADMILCLYSDIDLHRQILERFRLIREQKDNDSITVPELKVSRAAPFMLGRTFNEYAIYWGDLEEELSGNRNIMFAQYYGLKGIHSQSQEE